MKNQHPRLLFAVLPVLPALLACGACTRTDDTSFLPSADAERARELSFLSEPPVHGITREEYTASIAKDAASVSDDYVRAVQGAYGRLGFFARDFDPRTAPAVTSDFYVAYYSTKTKDITVIGTPDRFILVHELTHALQDQHFDLTRLAKTARSSDEAMAISGLVEGDAVMAESRYLATLRGTDPAAEVAGQTTPSMARAASEGVLDQAQTPLFFAALPAFAYSYGPTYVATRMGLFEGSWSLAPINALFQASGPASTQEVMRGGIDVDDIVPTGFASVPPAIAPLWATALVDRLGEWYTYLLLRPAVPNDAARLARGWDGDQLVMMRSTDASIPAGTAHPTAIVWTTSWDTPALATEVAAALVTLQGGRQADTSLGVHGYVTADGELAWIEARDTHVCLVKSFDAPMAEHLADVALSTQGAQRLDPVPLKVMSGQ